MKTETRNEAAHSLKKRTAVSVGVIAVVCFLGWLFAEPPPSDMEIIAEQSEMNLELMQYTLARSRLDSLKKKAATVGLTAEEEAEEQDLIAKLNELNKRSEDRLRAR